MERDYFRRTVVFPIMHTVVIRRDLAAQYPGLARSVYQAFCKAKDATAAQYKRGLIFYNMNIMLPWFWSKNFAVCSAKTGGHTAWKRIETLSTPTCAYTLNKDCPSAALLAKTSLCPTYAPEADLSYWL